MALGWVIGSTVAQLFLAFFLFMCVAFSASSIGNLHTLTSWQDTLLNLSLFALPGSCVVSAGAVIYCYKTGSGPMGYWWNALPLALTVVYFVYAVILNNLPSSQ